MKNLFGLVILFFAFASSAAAQQATAITNGNLLIDMTGVNAGVFRSYLNMKAAGFQFSVTGGDDLTTYPNVGTIHRAGDVIVQNRTFSETMRGAGTVNNTVYETVFLYNSSNPQTVLSFECENFTVPYSIIARRQATYQTPCKMKGNLYIYASPSSLTPLFASPIYGEAIAFVKFERYTHDRFQASRFKYLLRSVNYVFVNP
jgi:hypothetical protein